MPRPAGRVAIGVIDQGVSSATNLIATVFAARTLTPEAFGAFAIAFSVYLLSTGLLRSLVGDPLIIRYSAMDPLGRHGGVRAGAAPALSMAVTFGACVAVVGLLLPGSTGSVLIWLGVLQPILIMHEYWRTASYVCVSPHLALALDTVWAASLVVLFLNFDWTSNQPHIVIILWGSSAFIGATAGFVLYRCVPSVHASVIWLRRNLDLWPRFLAEAALVNGGALAVMTSLSVAGGLGAAGALRGGQALLGPISIAITGLSLSAGPMLAALFSRSSYAAHRQTTVFAALVAAAASVAFGLVLVLPESLGQALLGSSWASSRDVAAVLAFGIILAAPGTSASWAVRAVGASKQSLRARSWATGIWLAIALPAALSGNALWVASAMSAAGLVGSILWWTTWRTTSAAHRAAEGSMMA